LPRLGNLWTDLPQKDQLPAKIPSSAPFTSQVENALENAAQEAELERIQLKNKAVQRKIPKKTRGCLFKG